MYKLDLKDRKILYELDKNARISYAQLGKKIGLSTEVIHYRVKKLEEQKIIVQYQTAVDYSKLDLILFKMCFKLNGISLEEEEKLYNKIKLMPKIVWVAKCQGDWDCMISSTVGDLNELDVIKDKVIGILGKYVYQKSISIPRMVTSHPRNYLINKKEKILHKKTLYPMVKKTKVDETDIKLLKVLSADARKPVIEIAKEMNSTVKIVSSRIKKLLKDGVINSFRLVIDYDKLGINFYKTFFYLKSPDETRIKQLLTKLDLNQNVVHNLKAIGDWDLEPEFEFEDKADFQKTIQSLMDEFSDIIQRISIVNILKEYKFTFFYK